MNVYEAAAKLAAYNCQVASLGLSIEAGDLQTNPLMEFPSRTLFLTVRVNNIKFGQIPLPFESSRSNEITINGVRIVLRRFNRFDAVQPQAALSSHMAPFGSRLVSLAKPSAVAFTPTERIALFPQTQPASKSVNDALIKLYKAFCFDLTPASNDEVVRVVLAALS